MDGQCGALNATNRAAVHLLSHGCARNLIFSLAIASLRGTFRRNAPKGARGFDYAMTRKAILQTRQGARDDNSAAYPNSIANVDVINEVRTECRTNPRTQMRFRRASRVCAVSFLPFFLSFLLCSARPRTMQLSRRCS